MISCGILPHRRFCDDVFRVGQQGDIPESLWAWRAAKSRRQYFIGMILSRKRSKTQAEVAFSMQNDGKNWSLETLGWPMEHVQGVLNWSKKLFSAEKSEKVSKSHTNFSVRFRLVEVLIPHYHVVPLLFVVLFCFMRVSSGATWILFAYTWTLLEARSQKHIMKALCMFLQETCSLGKGKMEGKYEILVAIIHKTSTQQKLEHGQKVDLASEIKSRTKGSSKD